MALDENAMIFWPTVDSVRGGASHAHFEMGGVQRGVAHGLWEMPWFHPNNDFDAEIHTQSAHTATRHFLAPSPGVSCDSFDISLCHTKHCPGDDPRLPGKHLLYVFLPGSGNSTIPMTLLQAKI